MGITYKNFQELSIDKYKVCLYQNVGGPMPNDIEIRMPDGTTQKGQKIEVTEEFEGWCKYTLEDGTKIKLKPVVLSAIRTENYTDDGEPIYLVKSHNIIITDAPPALRRDSLNATDNK